jgi:hypothetical protein
MINTNYKNKKRRTKSVYAAMGYWNEVMILGKLMYVREASMNYPIELFALVTAKQVRLADRVYQNLLDCIRVINPWLYEAHRAFYHEEVVRNTIKKQQQELDHVVRTQLRGENLDTITMIVKGKSRTYQSLGAPAVTKTNSRRKKNSYTFLKQEGSFVQLETGSEGVDSTDINLLELI